MSSNRETSALRCMICKLKEDITEDDRQIIFRRRGDTVEVWRFRRERAEEEGGEDIYSEIEVGGCCSAMVLSKARVIHIIALQRCMSETFEPIESDPRIFTNLMHRLGVEESFQFVDVLDIEEESQQPALALIVVFRETHDDELNKASFEATRVPVDTKNITFLRQTIDNSCGLVAILHCVFNTLAATSITHHSVIYNALRSGKGITTFLEESKELEIEYQSAVESGETDILDEVNYHYVALVACQGQLYELDGERLSPLIKGSSVKMGYLLNTPDQIKKIIDSFSHGGLDCFLYKLSHSIDV